MSVKRLVKDIGANWLAEVIWGVVGLLTGIIASLLTLSDLIYFLSWPWVLTINTLALVMLLMFTMRWRLQHWFHQVILVLCLGCIMFFSAKLVPHFLPPLSNQPRVLVIITERKQNSLEPNLSVDLEREIVNQLGEKTASSVSVVSIFFTQASSWLFPKASTLMTGSTLKNVKFLTQTDIAILLKVQILGAPDGADSTVSPLTLDSYSIYSTDMVVDDAPFDGQYFTCWNPKHANRPIISNVETLISSWSESEPMGLAAKIAPLIKFAIAIRDYGREDPSVAIEMLNDLKVLNSSGSSMRDTVDFWYFWYVAHKNQWFSSDWWER